MASLTSSDNSLVMWHVLVPFSLQFLYLLIEHRTESRNLLAVSVSLRYGYYGDSHMVLGPSSSRLLKASSVFVGRVEVIDDDKKGVFLYSFSEKPVLSVETNWNVSNYLIVGSYSQKVYIYIYIYYFLVAHDLVNAELTGFLGSEGSDAMLLGAAGVYFLAQQGFADQHEMGSSKEALESTRSNHDQRLSCLVLS